MQALPVRPAETGPLISAAAEDVLLHCLQHCTLEALQLSTGVCTKWRALAADVFVWMPLWR